MVLRFWRSCPSISPELQCHWKQLSAIWVVFFVIAGVTYQTPPVLFPALMKEFNATQYGISVLPSTFQLVKGIFTIPGGFWMHRFGIKWCIRVGTLVALLGAAFYPAAHSLWILGVLHGVYGIAYDLCGLAAMLVLTASWFDKQRASAIGIVVTAFSMAGVAFPPFVAAAIERHGWRIAAAGCPLIMLVFVMPLAFGVLRDGPLLSGQRRDMAMFPNPQPCPFQSIGSATLDENSTSETGSETVHIASTQQALAETGTIEDANLPHSFVHSLRHKAVWHLAFISFYQLYIVISLINTLVIYLKQDAGLPLDVCGFYTSLVFVASIVGKLLIGIALDSKLQRVAGMGSCLLLFIGTLLSLEVGANGLQPTASRTKLLIFAVVYGLGYGSSYSVVSSKPAKMFGKMPEFSKLQAFLMLFQVIGGFLGTLASGKLRVSTGSYTVPFSIFILMGFLGCVHYYFLELGVTRDLTQVRERVQRSA